VPFSGFVHMVELLYPPPPPPLPTALILIGSQAVRFIIYFRTVVRILRICAGVPDVVYLAANFASKTEKIFAF
jgi:hypothetical protein